MHHGLLPRRGHEHDAHHGQLQGIGGECSKMLVLSDGVTDDDPLLRPFAKRQSEQRTST